MVESKCGAVSLGRTYLFLLLSSGGALVVLALPSLYVCLFGEHPEVLPISDRTAVRVRNDESGQARLAGDINLGVWNVLDAKVLARGVNRIRDDDPRFSN
jgi:hypothetical protein